MSGDLPGGIALFRETVAGDLPGGIALFQDTVSGDLPGGSAQSPGHCGG